MNLLEENRDNYLRRVRNPRRILVIVAGVVVFHVAVIAIVANWHGWQPKPVEGLIRVSIVADKRAAPAH